MRIDYWRATSGKLEDPQIRQVNELGLNLGWKLLVMCGHTEATARISYVPFKQLGRKIGLVVIPVRGASLTIDPVTAELVYPGLSRS
jgi:long-chain acyl-CoA synthetase